MFVKIMLFLCNENMVKDLQKYFLWVVLMFCLGKGKAQDVEDYLPLVRQYQLAYNNADFTLLDSFVITPKLYSGLIGRVEKEQPECLTEFDKSYDVGIFKRDFEQSHLFGLKTDTIVIDKITDLSSCANLDIKKLACFVYFRKINKSVPISIIVIATEQNRYKILLDIINENHFTDEKF